MNLQDYFEEPLRSAAVGSYLRKFGSSWDLPSKLQTYSVAKIARSSSSAHEDRKSASDTVYSTVWNGWKAGEGASRRHWSSDDLYDFFVSYGEPFFFETISDATKLEDIALQESLRWLLGRMQSVKENKTGYPWVAVSKFLHVANPALFPIYDIRHVWQDAISVESRHSSVFGTHFKMFCWEIDKKADDWSSEFNLTYARFAARVISQAGNEFMSWFGRWYAEQLHSYPDPQNVLPNVSQYSAAAFEMILLGATYLNR